jgi:hypothetical protein
MYMRGPIQDIDDDFLQVVAIAETQMAEYNARTKARTSRETKPNNTHTDKYTNTQKDN